MSETNLKDLSTFGHILRWIQGLQEKHWRQGTDLRGIRIAKRTKDNYAKITNSVCFPIKAKELDSCIKECVDGNLQLTVENLFLPPLDIDGEFVPILTLTSDFSAEVPITRLCVGMFGFTNRNKPKVLSFRFETAHANSNHDYCHGQLTREYTASTGKVFSGLPSWTPEHIPCILIPSNNPVSLIFCLLISFYGVRFYTMISKLSGIDGKHFEPFACLSLRRE
jgi:hypothetical protein